MLLLGAILLYENPPQHMRGHRHRNDSHSHFFFPNLLRCKSAYAADLQRVTAPPPIPPGLNIGHMAKSLWAPRAAPTECGTTELFRRARAEPNIKIGGGGWMTSIRYESDAPVCRPSLRTFCRALPSPPRVVPSAWCAGALDSPPVSDRARACPMN